MRCLICHEEIIPEVSWVTFWKPPVEIKMCGDCRAALEKIDGPCCPVCHRPDHKGVCRDCEQWSDTQFGTFDKNVAVFRYNEFGKKFVARWKYRGDYVLFQAIKKEIQRKWEMTGVEKHIIVPVPLSKQREAERGFNQSEAIILALAKEPISLFDRLHSEKQSKRGKKERMQSENPFILRRPVHESVVIVDDIYTTGRTVRHMASRLREYGCPSVSSFTIFR
ncbi:competence protein ComFC [Halobacillus dabanensis]|uniref:Competence protein ComFC n=1 Tax=Halobacillus dabanensis TaxID=240302 RepID=A0A1I3RHT3_HALDA|nr:ComF family protein [Halobacillus dabanensis]SFJ45845.1 competence protein ComFC [Halobacillus dabanensis]